MKHFCLTLMCLYALCVSGQETLQSSYIDVNYFKGNIALHNNDILHLIQGHPEGLIVSWNKKTFGKNSGLHLDKIYESIHSTKKDIKATVSSALEGLDKFYPLTTEKKINGKRFSHEPNNVAAQFR